MAAKKKSAKKKATKKSPNRGRPPTTIDCVIELATGKFQKVSNHDILKKLVEQHGVKRIYKRVSFDVVIGDL